MLTCDILIFMTISAVLAGGIPGIYGYFGLTDSESLLTLSVNVEDNHTAGREANKAQILCDAMNLDKKQKRMCKRGEGIPETLLESSRLAVAECQNQFQDDRWNCSLGQHRIGLLDRGFKETSYMYSISAAALVHALSRACSQHRLDICTCDESFNQRKNREAWFWGGCGDNIKYGQKFIRQFLKSTSWGKDLRAKVDQHNSKLGIKVVKDSIAKTCKCHGVSGSCTVKTCWRKLAPFQDTGAILKIKYDDAIKVVISENNAKGKIELKKKRKTAKEIAPRKGDMVFIDKSPNYCKAGAYTSGTRGRRCDKTRNCETLCCGRGYNTLTRTVTKSCQCQVIWCCYVKCQTCRIQEEIYVCK